MSKIIKIKLQALEKGMFEIEEMVVAEDGTIQRVIPKTYNGEYKGLHLYLDTCEVGKRPILSRALATYHVELPCVVTETTDWINEDYACFEIISFYPVTTTEDYMEEICHKEMAVMLNKDDLFPIYQRYNGIVGIEEHLLDERRGKISYPVTIYERELRNISKSRKPVTSLMRQKMMEWKRIYPMVYFKIEYSMSLTLN